MSAPANEVPKYRVGMVSRLTGLSTHTLRMWEKRYAAVVPARTEAGGRLYNDAQVERLRRLKQLVDAGHTIGGIATLPQEDLSDLLGLGQPEVAATSEAARVQQAFLEAISRLDLMAAERVLSRAAAALAPRDFVLEIVGPTMLEVGKRWEDGRFRIVHEHLSSSVLRGLLFSLARLYPAREQGKTVVIGTPAGERHEIGAITTAILASMHGWRVLYLGTDLPAAEYGYVAQSTDAKLVLLSVVNLPREAVVSAVCDVRDALRPEVRLIVGGAASRGLELTGVEVMHELTELERVLR